MNEGVRSAVQPLTSYRSGDEAVVPVDLFQLAVVAKAPQQLGQLLDGLVVLAVTAGHEHLQSVVDAIHRQLSMVREHP